LKLFLNLFAKEQSPQALESKLVEEEVELQLVSKDSGKDFFFFLKNLFAALFPDTHEGEPKP
jgi:hypothetical protein